MQCCPVGCISLIADEEGFVYPSADEKKCIRCGLCEKVCPVLKTAESREEAPHAYAAYNLNEEIRMKSSSGGVFSLLAEAVLSVNGTVYGAAMTQHGEVEHIRITESSELELLRGSKYVQSRIGRTYLQAKADLEEGKRVLFSGTPCQIEGLHRVLGKDYANLLCMDIICHGVPSPMVWKKYVAFREEMAESKMQAMSFRDKKLGWSQYAVLFRFANNVQYREEHGKDLYIKAFIGEVCLRPSCYACSFKKVSRISDITAADFWGIRNVCPEMDDDRGTSLVIVHSEKGAAAMEALAETLRCREVDLDQALAGNRAMVKSAPMPKNRDAFLREIATHPFDKTVEKYVKRRISIKSVIKRVLIRLGLWNSLQKLRKN